MRPWQRCGMKQVNPVLGRRGALLGLLAAAAAPRALAAGPAPPERPVSDASLVLAIDLSASVSTGTAAFQLRGHAVALRDPAVQAAIGAGLAGAIDLAVIGYGAPGPVATLMPWRRVATAAEVEAAAAAIEALPTGGPAAATAIGSALLGAAALFEAPEAQGARRVVDIVANGFSNAGPEPEIARDALSARGIVVNALVILDEYDWLEAYFRERVITGAGAFARPVAGPDGFGRALVSKLVQEIAAAPAAIYPHRRD